MSVSGLISLLGVVFAAASVPAAFLAPSIVCWSLAATGVALQGVAYLVWRHWE